MGTLEYNSSRSPIQVDDQTLTHLKIVIGTKLRRQESFMMTWLPRDEVPASRLTIWLHPSIPSSSLSTMPCCGLATPHGSSG